MSNFKRILTAIIAAMLVFGMLPIGIIAETLSGAGQSKSGASAPEYQEWKLPTDWRFTDKQNAGTWELPVKGAWALRTYNEIAAGEPVDAFKAPFIAVNADEASTGSPSPWLSSVNNYKSGMGPNDWYLNHKAKYSEVGGAFRPGALDGKYYVTANVHSGPIAAEFTAPADGTYDFKEALTVTNIKSYNGDTLSIGALVMKVSGGVVTVLDSFVSSTTEQSSDVMASSVELKAGDQLLFGFYNPLSGKPDFVNDANKEKNYYGCYITELIVSIGEKPDDYDKPKPPEAPDWSDITGPVYPAGEEPLLVIGAVSDPHTDYGLQTIDPYIRPAYITALKTLKKEGIDLLLVGGDITSDNEDNGGDLRWDKDTYNRTVSQYEAYSTIASKTGISLWACGNHDHEVGRLTGGIVDGDYDSYAGFQDIMVNSAGKPISLYTQKDDNPKTPSIYLDRWLGAHYNLEGFDFIVLNGLYNAFEDYSVGTLNWLDKTLAGIGADKTVFIIGHYPLTDNRGITTPTYGLENASYDNFVKVMSKYDNAIYLYGHNHGGVGQNLGYISGDVFERITHYDANGGVINDRTVTPSSFVTAFMGSAGYYANDFDKGGLGAADPQIIQAMTISIYADRIEFKMINCGKQTGPGTYPTIWTLKRNIVAPKHEDGPAANTNGLWELGTVSSANGMNTDSASNVRIGRHISISDFTEVTIGAGYKLMYFAYDHANNYLGNNGNAWGADGGKITMASIKEKYPSATTFKIVMKKTNGANMSISDVITSGVKTVVNANAPETELTYNGSIYGIKVEYANGAILANGKVDKKASGQYCKTYLPISEFTQLAGSGDALVKYFAYDANLKLLASGGTDLSQYSIQYIKNSYPGVAYFRFNITTSGSDAVLKSNISATHTFKQKIVSTVNSQQDGALYNGKLFMFDKEGNCYVSDYKTGAQVATFQLGSLNKIKPFCNAVSFSDVFYAKGDKYPLLYANVYNTYESQTDRKEGHLCVYRITENGSTFTAQLVQIIKIGFVNDLDLWKSKKDNGDVRSYGNFVIDTDKNELIAFVARDASMTTRFFRFKLPSAKAGTSSSAYGCKVVTLNKKNIIDQFDVDYIPYIQGCTYYDGSIISVSGMQGEGKIHVIDIARGDISTSIDCASIGLNDEPQMVDVDRSTGKIIYTASDNVVRAFDFGQYKAPTAKEVYGSASSSTTTKPSDDTTVDTTAPTDTTDPSTTTTPPDTSTSEEDDTTKPSETTPPDTSDPDNGGKKGGNDETDYTILIAVLIGVGCLVATVVIWIAFGPKNPKKVKDK